MHPDRTGSLGQAAAGEDRTQVFLREGNRVFHTYSAYERGPDSLLGTYRWLDLTPLGRRPGAHDGRRFTSQISLPRRRPFSIRSSVK